MVSWTACIRCAVLAAGLMALASCGPQDISYSAAEYGGLAGKAAMAAAPEPNQGKHLAVSHIFTLLLPSDQVEAIQNRHLAECVKLGGAVLETRLDRTNVGRISARTSIRLSPQAYTAFVTIMTAPPAEVMTHVEMAEDKTLPMIDVEKRLEVKTTLRDRLTSMLREPGKKSAADLAAIEKELAQVQADIEAATSQRDYLRTITETIKIDINYNGMAAQAGQIDLSPIDFAIKGIGRTIVSSIAMLISFIAAIVPWLPAIALIVWGVRRSLRRWKERKAARG